MTDSLGPRGKFAVLAPSTNTSVQPEYEALRPWGVTHHHSRLVIPDTRVSDDASFMAMMDNIPAGDRQVRRFFTDCGYRVVNLLGLKCRSPVLIAHESKERLRDAILEVNRGRVDAIVQVGTNLAMAQVAALAEFWLGKPVIAINTATYWYALRSYGIRDKVAGWGSLLAEH
jgi:maleate isomerase